MAKIFLTSGSSWAGVATDGSDIIIECIGGGGNGAASAGGSTAAAGGGGAYAKKTVPYVSGSTVTGLQIGAALDTQWDGGVVIAKAGGSATGVTTPGAGGSAAACTPSTGAFSGGAGGVGGGSSNGGAGGGGAAGPGGNGKAGGRGNFQDGGAGGGGAGGGSSTAGGDLTGSNGANGGTAQDGTAGGSGSASVAGNTAAGGAGSHGSGGGGSGASSGAGATTGAGGTGGTGIEFDSTHGAGGGGGGSGGRTSGAAANTGPAGGGGLYGGGGGGGGWTGSGTFGAGGSGASGLIVITYTPPSGIEPTGIASEEAFGTLAIARGAVLLSPPGIASGEAFGTAEVILDDPNILRPAGIGSGEAFGALAVIPGEVAASPPSIASAEAVGHPRVAQSVKSRLLVGGINRTDYIHHESSFSWNMLKGARGSCSIPLIVEPGDELAPAVGELIEIFDPVNVRVWAGTIEQVFTRWFGDDGWHLFVITGVTLDSLFDAAFVDKTVFDGVAGGTAFSDLFTASGVTQVTLGTVAAGSTITALEVTRISDGFSSIALRSNLVWFIDPADLTLNLVSSSARPAPWIMQSEDMVWETMQWRQSRADFRDTQVIQSPDGTSQTIIAVTGNASIGRRTARLTITTSNTNPGAIEEATAVLRRFSTLPSQLVVSTDRPGVSIGMLLELSIIAPLEASGMLDGFWQVIEVEAEMLTGMGAIDTSVRRVPTDLSIGHFRYTLHLVNSLATAIFQGDGATTVFTLPEVPTSVSSIHVAPNGGLYATSSLGAAVTITPAMPPGTTGRVQYNGPASPDAGTFLDLWRAMTPLAASAGPAAGGGATVQRFIADSTLRDLTVMNDAAPHAIVYHAGTSTRALVVLRQALGADLVVRVKLNNAALVTLVVDSGTPVDDVLEYPLSARKFTVTIASPGVVTLSDASLGDGNTVVLHTTGALPTGLLAGTTYYVVSSAGGSFELAATLAGTPIDTSGTQSGTHWLTSPDIAAPAFVDKDILTLDVLASDGAIDKDGIASITIEWEG